MQKRLGKEKVEVVLVTVDPSYHEKAEEYVPQCKKALAKHKLTWPNTIAPKGWDDVTRIFNMTGYGKLVVDKDGIVRGIDVHGKELEKMVVALVEGKDVELKKK